MRIHELLEACLEYVVVEGVLGADPYVVRAHLQTLDANVDDAYFAHLWPLLARHPCTQVVIAADALPSVGGVVPDNVPPTDPLQNELFRTIEGDDGGNPPVNTGDLTGLLERYPSRIRLRGTDDEIYYRLTGSRKRIAKITPTIFTYLQLAARTREQGISALELGPMTDTTQNSAFHYIKVLVQLGLCAKIPASMHGSSTNVLVFRRFLEQNPHYCAHRARDSGDDDLTLTTPVVPVAAGDDEDDSEEARTHGGAQNLGFNFSPFSELELAVGRIPKERIIRVLEHPGLKNHLLGNHHLLQVIGWPDDTWEVRHRRQLQRHIATLIEEGIVEYVDIGTSARACLRHTKYNPDFVPLAKVEPVVTQQEEKEVAFNVTEYDKPFQFEGGALATQSIESQILLYIARSGLKGTTMAEVHKHLSSMFKRTLEHVVNRHDLAYLPPHLQHHAIRCVMESHQRMRRLRVFTSEAYLKYMEQLGQTLDALPTIEGQGTYADLSFRNFVASPDQYFAETEDLAAAIVPVGKLPSGRPRKSIGKTPRRSKATRKNDMDVEATASTKKGKATKVAEPIHSSPVKFKYDNDVQERGRPRKYVFIVNPDGSRNRHVVGNLLASVSLPSVLVYLKDENLLVEAPPGYTGVGVSPPISAEMIEATGRAPSFYRPMAEKKGKGKGTKAKAKGKGKKKATKDGEEGEELAESDTAAEGEEDEIEEDEVDEVVEGEEDHDVPPSSPTAAPAEKRAAKRRRTGAAPAALEEVVEEPLVEVEATPKAPPLALADDETPAPAETPMAVDTPIVDTPEPETPTRTKRPRRAAGARALSALSRSATPASDRGSPDTAEPAPKRPRRFQKVTQPEPEPEPTPPAPEIDPALVSLSAESETPGAATEAADATAAEVVDVPSRETEAAEAMDVDAPAPAADASEPQTDELAAVNGDAQTTHEEEPLTSIDDVKAEEIKEETRPRVVRVDIAVLRRANEIYQCLLDSGRVLSDQKLYIEQKNWSHKYAGTDHPFAPQVGASMDRKVFKRMVNRLKDDGRLKERIATIPTTTGRWIKVPVLYIADTDESEVQTYIRGLANSTAPPPGTPVPAARSKSSLEYSAYRRSAPRTSQRMQSGSGVPDSPTPAAGNHEGLLSKREAFLSEPTMAAYLYGFQSGRCLRTKLLHTALVEAFTTITDSKSIVCKSPRVFALPFVFEDLRVRDYFYFVQVRGYDDELYQWLQVPGNTDMRLGDVPADIAEKAALTGRLSSGAKSMVRTLISMLSFLQLIMPLTPVDKEDAVVHCTDNPGDHIGHFARGQDISTATYFLLHDVVPIYNIADTSLPCLGFMSAKTTAEVNLVWRTIKQASLETQPPFIRRMDVPAFPFAPDVSGVLDMTIDHPKTLRSRNRWRHDIRLVPEQRANLDATIDMSTRQRRVTDDDEVAKLAYDNGLQPSYVNQYLDRRVRQLQGEGNQPARLPSEKAAVTRQREREKRQKQKEAIRDELAARIRAARQVYDERIRTAAERAGVEVNQDLRDYITHNRPMSRLGEIASDAELAAIIESFIRVKNGYAPVRRSHASRPAPTVVRSSVISKRVKRIKNPNAKLRRYRHNWTKDDEETLIDAEAVIRARCRGTNNRGRLAMVQIFPSIGDQVLRTKLKKLLEQPGREAYYRRLEDAFYHLWVEFRGSPELPDTNPMSHTDFDLKRHVEFLREKVNKNLLKLPVPSTTPSSKDRAPDLPLAPLEVATVYQWEYLKAINTTMDQLVESSTAAEDTRLHNVSLASIVTEDPRKHRGDIAPMSRMQGIVRGVLKMIVGTPTEIYSTVDASRVLSTPLEKHEPLIAALVNEQVLLKNISGSARQIPGRMYGFTTQWLQQSDNLLPMDLEVEVDAALARFDNPEQTTQWPLIGTGGDLAALMTMVSNHEAEFDIDLSNLPSLRTNRLQYNTRALNDDAFEFDFAVTRTSTEVAERIPLPKPREFPRMTPWPGTGLIASHAQVETVVDAVRNAGVEGLERGMMSQLLGMTVEDVDSVIQVLALEEPPRVFWAGYNNASLVASTHWADWSASVSPRAEGRPPKATGEVVPAAPRRWVDIWGDLILADWQRALKLVIGTITTRPGLTEAALRARVAPFLDRLETCDVLQYLVDTRMMARKLSIPTHRPLPPVHATDGNEMPFIVWVPNPAFLWGPVDAKPAV